MSAAQSRPTLASSAHAGTDEVVLGVDTHKDIHAAAVVTEIGTLLASRAFPATAIGYQRMVAWARSFGAVRRAGVECTGSYGAALTRHLRTQDIEVVEVNQPDTRQESCPRHTPHRISTQCVEPTFSEHEAVRWIFVLSPPRERPSP